MMKNCPNCRSIYPNHFTVCPRDAAPLVDSDEWSEGAVIRGKYRILGKVGQGGMGAVYKALHMKFDQVRALKVMTGDMAADAEFVNRFEREAVLMSKLQHPNIVRVDDIDEAEDGSPFIVMEFVEGRSLRQAIEQEGPLQPLRACAIARQAAAGLGAAHLMGMVHRDIKPDNIILVNTPAGETAKVLDFGIAKLKEAKLGDGLRTATGIVIGTAQYLSPEQALGTRSEDLDGRSDLYSLGLVMYQMLTCALPFHADSAVGWMLARLNEPPRPILTARPDLAIPSALAKLVMRCLEKDRELRPADADVLIKEIEQVEGEIRRPAQPLVAPTVIVPEQVQPRVKPVEAAAPLPPTRVKAFSTSRWARGWKFYAGLALIVLLPFSPNLVNHFTRGEITNPVPMTTGGIMAAIGALGWWLATRPRWVLRIIALLPLAVVIVLPGHVIYDGIANPGYRAASSYTQISMADLKKADRSPLEISPLSLGAGPEGRPVLKFTLQNIASDARITDWKAHTLLFDSQGKLLSDEAPTKQTELGVDPGKMVPVDLYVGEDNAKTGKFVLQEVDYEITIPAGTKDQGVWINPHFQEDLEKAKQP